MSDSCKPRPGGRVDAPKMAAFHGLLTPEAMVEIANEITRELEAMSPEARAAYESKKRFDAQIRDEELLKDETPEERAKILEMRERFHDNIRAVGTGSRPIQLDQEFTFEGLLRGIPPELLGAEAALRGLRERSRRRPKPRSDGW